jgi:hypothetical protein
VIRAPTSTVTSSAFSVLAPGMMSDAPVWTTSELKLSDPAAVFE